MIRPSNLGIAPARSLVIFLLLEVAICAPVCQPPLAAQTRQPSCGVLNVAAAADLSDVMNKITANFQKQAGCAVRLSTGSSGNFLSEIENGAPFDVFLSANFAYPKKLEAEGLADPGSTYLYAIGKIVLWVRKSSRLDIAKGLEALREPSLQKLAIANPQHAPYGQAAEQALRSVGVYDAIKDRIVLGESVSQTAQFVESGNADAGIIALSSALSGELKADGRYALIPQKLYSPLDQGALIIRGAKNPQAAARFLEFLKSPDARALLAQYGFELPPQVPR